MVLASRNPGKLAEFQRLLAPGGWWLRSLDEVPGGPGVGWEETAPTYLGNALLKAEKVAAGTFLPALGDDSGIEVLALGRWPGLRTARWLGEGATPAELREGLRARVAELPPDRRQAEFVCALALVVPRPGGDHFRVTVEERLGGTLLASPRGSGGFGYDPIFVPGGDERTMAEMPGEEKDRRSHRGLAVARLLNRLRSD